MKPARTLPCARLHIIAGLIFGLVALAHILRIANNWEVSIGPYHIPMWISWAGLLLDGALCILFLRH